MQINTFSQLKHHSVTNDEVQEQRKYCTDECADTKNDLESQSSNAQTTKRKQLPESYLQQVYSYNEKIRWREIR